MNESEEQMQSVKNDTISLTEGSTPLLETKIDDLKKDEPIIELPIDPIKDENKIENDENSLKNLLSVPAASIAVPVPEEMITRTEVTNEELKLRKIIYVTDNDEKKVDSNDGHVDEDDRRLVIAISDDEGSELLAKAKKKVRSSETSVRKAASKTNETHRQDSQKALIEYKINTSGKDGSIDRVEIDFHAHVTEDNETSKTDRIFTWPNIQSQNKKDSPLNNMSVTNELNLISSEIDRKLKKKTICIIEVVQEYLNLKIGNDEFAKKMQQAADTTTEDLVSISKRLQKRKKFERNPNVKEFLKMKNLHFSTSSTELTEYFRNLLPSMSLEKFANMIKLYESIVMEMLKLNKTKMLQYIIDFMVVRKNSQLDLLNFNFNTSSEPVLIQPESSSDVSTSYNLTSQSRYTTSERKPRSQEFSYNFTIRSDPIYQLSGNFQTSHLNVMSSRMIFKAQSQSFDKKPFDNNVLRGRRIARRLVDERSHSHQIHHSRKHHLQIPRVIDSSPTATIVLDSDTPPPSLPSEPNSPPQHRIPKVQIISNDIVQPPIPISQLEKEPIEVNAAPVEIISLEQNGINSELNVQLQEANITLQEWQTLSQNGTEIIPTSFVKPSLPLSNDQSRLLVAKSPENSNDLKNLYERRITHSHDETSTGIRMKRTPMRRKSCHERILNNGNQHSQIERTYMSFLDDFERITENNTEFNGQLRHDFEKHLNSKRQRLDPGYHRNVQMMQQSASKYQQPIQSQYNMNVSRKPRPPLNYNLYQERLQREMRDRGYENMDQIQPQSMEIVTNIHPEHYSQPPHYPTQKQPSITKSIPTRIPQPQLMDYQSQAAMMAAAYQQLQSMHRESANLPPQQYAEHLKRVENLKHLHRQSSEDQHLRAQQQQQQKAQEYFNTHNPYQQSSNASRQEENFNSFSLTEPQQSLQRKLKYKSRSTSNYVEPSKPVAVNQNPPHSIYYSEPFSMRNKASSSSSPLSGPVMPSAFHPPETQRGARIPRDHINRNQHMQQQPQPIQHHQPIQPQAQSWLASTLMTQRSPQSYETNVRNVNGTSQHLHPQKIASHDQQPTEFLRTFYAQNNQKNY